MKSTKKTTMVISIATVLVVAMTLVSAGLLQYFGVIETTANVQQSVVWNGGDEWYGWDEPIQHEFDIIGGHQACFKTKIWNRGCTGGWHGCRPP